MHIYSINKVSPAPRMGKAPGPSFSSGEMNSSNLTTFTLANKTSAYNDVLVFGFSPTLMETHSMTWKSHSSIEKKMKTKN